MKPFATADLCDQFGDEVRVALPVFRGWGGAGSFAGPVETVRVFEDNALVRQALEEQGSGRVLVVDGGGSVRTALVGGNLAALARSNGWSGLVVNGAVRDTAELLAIPVGVKALAAVPRKSAKTGAGERGIAVTFAGVTFRRGDYCYADGDGLLLASRDLQR